MTINLRIAAAAVALVAAAPASASLFTYQFTAGGPGAYSYANVSSDSCTNGNCTNSSVEDSDAFTLDGSFTVDTSKLPADGFYGSGGLAYDSYPDQDAAAQFLSASITKTGGMSLPASGGGGSRSYLYGYDSNVGGGGSFFQAFAQGPSATLNYLYEYHANGAVKRQYYHDDYVQFYIYNSTPSIGTLDGHDFATAFADIIANGYAQLGFYTYEVTFDEFGQQLTYLQASGYAQAAITSLNAAPGGPASEVPEPAMLGLFGLGMAGLAAGRRRKAA